MNSGRWNDAMLDEMRQRGDDEADAVIAEVFADGDLAAVQKVLNTLVLNDEPPPGSLPAVVREYSQHGFKIDPNDLPRATRGEDLFAEHGPEMLMILLFYSLPSSYAGRNGVQVLYRTAYLTKKPRRRMVETCQMIIDVMAPGGLAAGGRGVRSAQKVRLMHAAIRHLLLNDPNHPWDTKTLGVPINQEDLAGTLTPFSWAIIDGLHKLGVEPGKEAEEAYLDAWRVVGRIMGISPLLLPANMDEAFELGQLIFNRQCKESAEGRAMTAALLEAVEENLPSIFHGVPASMVRFFLRSDVCDWLDVPHHPLEEHLVRIGARLTGELDKLLLASQRRAAFLRLFSMQVIQWLINVDRGGKRVKFHIPSSIHERWHGPIHGHEPTFWHQLKSWIASEL